MVLSLSVLLLPAGSQAADQRAGIEQVVAQAIRPMMERYGVPGMAVGLVVDGQEYVYTYGVASKATGQPVSADTLFEIGSLSKTFTATLASYAQVDGKLALTDVASKYLPSLSGSNFDKVSLLNLGTHTSGGLPLQVPNEITTDAQLMAYFRNWQPAHAAGTYRIYSNPSIGLLGLIAAQRMDQGFDAVMEGKLFPALGMKNTYLQVPKSQMENYAQGYTTKDAPIRMAPGMLASEAYGVRTTAGAMLRFIKANMGMIDLDANLQRAIMDTHTGYYRIGAMTQDLIWEQYRYPVELRDLLAGNSSQISYEANPATALDPPSPPRGDVLIDKTGSTNGFAAYVAFVPGKRLGIVLLANKNHPIAARVTAAYDILTRLGGASQN
ncbi:MAG TPA: class C beta-lactamase [Aliidongia sp.]|uniref:class C beta-lactamase n=1 Tax=Aliidongia sp. TaxID=1914230 RepID=UPI002DDD33FC|nr:class C beta-lactamase [Aliidongia sp.]HEV2675478.1 class C beta-lactamase [Aliidongia sp.]